MPKKAHGDYRCQADGCNETNAAWGFNGRFFCTDHKAQGEALMTATSDGMSGNWTQRPAADDLPASQQPDGQPVQGVLI